MIPLTSLPRLRLPTPEDDVVSRTAHELSPVEQALLDALLERFDFTPIVVRLTDTMLEKSIIDARGPIQTYLARTGLVDYRAIGQGQDNKVVLALPFVTVSESSRRNTSFYRPNTKKGDPRFWIERLKSATSPGDALVVAFSGVDLVFIHLVGTEETLARQLEGILPSRFEERGEIETTVRGLAQRLAPLAAQWIRTGRPGPTGVGYTLESFLDVSANSSRLPDFPSVELKAYRRGSSVGMGKLVSLFAKTPNWRGVAKGLGLLRGYGYQDDKRGRLALYCTITSTRNSLGWALVPDYYVGRVLVQHQGVTVVDYDFGVLEESLRNKHPATLFVRATARGVGAGEEFRYDEVVLCREPSLANLLELLEADQLGLDFTLHQRADGTARDHGYLWRIREPAIPKLYAYRRVISSLHEA
jgi:hypothetical protein